MGDESSVISQSLGWANELAKIWKNVEQGKRRDRVYYVKAQEAVRNSVPSDAPNPNIVTEDVSKRFGVTYAAPNVDTGNGGGPVTRGDKQSGRVMTALKWAGVGLLSALGMGLLFKAAG